MQSQTQDAADTVQVLSGTVVVVDMVAYSSIARLLEENTSASVVSELNRQIQSFIQAGLSELPEGSAHTLIMTTGDGAIVLFDSAECAHQFANAVHQKSHQHNKDLTEHSAKRWFRAGIATGEITRRRDQNNQREYAGLTISNAVRLEEAARPGQIVIDLATYKLLPAHLCELYSTEHIVAGKRGEQFKARRYQAVARKLMLTPRRPLHLTRRRMLALTGGFAGAISLGAWFEWPEVVKHLHPLPEKRFVALMAWPAAKGDFSAIISMVLESIGNRLARAESEAKKNLLVLSSTDPTHVPPTVTSLTDTARSMGANLVLAASIDASKKAYVLTLQVLDAAKEQILRKTHTSCPPSKLDSLARTSSLMAAALLDLPTKEVALSDAQELGKVSPEALTAFAQAEEMAKQPNNAGLKAAIEKYRESVNLDTGFALGYAKLSIACTRRYFADGSTDQGLIALAAKNAKRATDENPNSVQAALSQALVALYSGQPNALDLFATTLKKDPKNPETLLYKARALRDLERYDEEEAVYLQILKDRPNYWPAYNELGFCRFLQRKYASAEEAFRLASTLATGVGLPLANLGLMRFVQGDPTQATAISMESLNQSKTDIAYLTLGNISFEQQKFQEARSWYEAAKELNPHYHLIWRNIGDCYQMLPESKPRSNANKIATLDNYRKAAQYLGDYLNANPRSGANWMTLAFYNAKIGERTLAEQDMREAERRQGTGIQAQFMKAQALMLLGRKQESLALVLACVRRGLSPVEVSLAIDLKDLQKDRAYLEMLAGHSNA